MYSPEFTAVPLSCVKIGVIGAGSRMRNVLRLLLGNPAAAKISITAVYDPDKDSVRQLRQDLAPEAHICASAEDLCAREDVDWVFIGSWNSYHAQQSIAAFKAGKHVFCEKPLALTLEEARCMRDAQVESNRTFALGLVLRYSPFYRKIRQVLDEQTIGRIVSFEFNETLTFNHGGYIHGNWRRKRANAGTHLLEKCCHDLDLMLWLAEDKPMRVASFGGCAVFTPDNNYLAKRIGPNPDTGRPAYQNWIDPTGINPFNDDKDIVDHQVAIVEFATGIRATFHTNCNAGIDERRFYVLGTEGTIRADAMTGVIEVRRIGWDESPVVYKPIEGNSHAGGDEVMTSELIDVLLNHVPPAAGFGEGVRSLALANAIDRSMDLGHIVNLDPTWVELESIYGPLFGRGALPQKHSPNNLCQ
ncbi:Gfo/Idh/MocA family oxidoreductase [Ruficoccus amylovorans]|uniref:Gfo/Idh/MocA family oxidoreductase n=1 Tax=Ruficoccus amylovorans TaxID=1804625 RepID=A0A842HKE3_9BACT|nr:Gfo/Idh/MocA family oxidoreductase [Ruficoccus amylovorans]MBC2596144.1 Gfo/Idh/MocA family oxidoreductase [Ruficoccus amylovorans]